MLQPIPVADVRRSLANELSDRSAPARDVLVESFALWESLIVDGLQTIAAREELSVDVDVNGRCYVVVGLTVGG
jgi:hypothetical protein